MRQRVAQGCHPTDFGIGTKSVETNESSRFDAGNDDAPHLLARLLCQCQELLTPA
jgi:hypothetical protein